MKELSIEEMEIVSGSGNGRCFLAGPYWLLETAVLGSLAINSGSLVTACLLT
tara:strand:- start:118 stop:273 length:156 start_codon:yes stop_codon:yes gene_type:complete